MKIFSDEYKQFINSLKDGDHVDMLIHGMYGPDRRWFKVCIEISDGSNKIKLKSDYNIYYLLRDSCIVIGEEMGSSKIVVPHDKELYDEHQKRSDLVHKISNNVIGLERFTTDELIDICKITTDERGE